MCVPAWVCVCGCIYMLTFHTSIRKYLQLYFFLCSPTCVYFCLVSILSFAQLAFYSFLFLPVSISLFALLFACWQSEAFVCKLHAFALQLMYISGIHAVRAKSRVGKWEIDRERERERTEAQLLNLHSWSKARRANLAAVFKAIFLSRTVSLFTLQATQTLV